jgi:hypothetical protein
MTATVTAEVFFIKEDLGASDLGFGLLFSTWMVGMVAGALLVARRVPARLAALGALLAVLVQGLGVSLPAAWVAVGFTAAMWFAGGVAHGTKNVLVRTLIAERVPSRLHAARSPPTTACATAPSSSRSPRSPRAACSSRPPARGSRSRWPARSPCSPRLPGSRGTCGSQDGRIRPWSPSRATRSLGDPP